MNMGPMSLSDDQSASLEARYVEAMVAHHQASITMAQDGLAYIQHAELRDLAERLIAAQEAEISRLQDHAR